MRRKKQFSNNYWTTSYTVYWLRINYIKNSLEETINLWKMKLCKLGLTYGGLTAYRIR